MVLFYSVDKNNLWNFIQKNKHNRTKLITGILMNITSDSTVAHTNRRTLYVIVFYVLDCTQRFETRLTSCILLDAGMSWEVQD